LRWGAEESLAETRKSGSALLNAFPDWDNAFHFIDEPLSGGEGFSAMRAENFQPQGRFADGHPTHPMNQSYRFNQRPTPFQFIQQSVELVGCHLQKCLILNAVDRSRIFSAPNQAAEAKRRANPVGGVAAGNQLGFMDGFGADD